MVSSSFLILFELYLALQLSAAFTTVFYGKPFPYDQGSAVHNHYDRKDTDLLFYSMAACQCMTNDFSQCVCANVHSSSTSGNKSHNRMNTQSADPRNNFLWKRKDGGGHRKDGDVVTSCLNVCMCVSVRVCVLYLPKLSGLSMEKHMRMTSVSG